MKTLVDAIMHGMCCVGPAKDGLKSIEKHVVLVLRHALAVTMLKHQDPKSIRVLKEFWFHATGEKL